MPPSGGLTRPPPKWTSRRPKRRRWGGVRDGGAHLAAPVAKGEGRCPPPRGPVDPTRRPGAVTQGQSEGSVGTTSRGKGRGCRGVRSGQAGGGGGA